MHLRHIFMHSTTRQQQSQFVIMKRVIPLPSFVLLCALAQLSLGQQCEPITVSMCQGIAYNMTALPNILQQTSQSDIASEINSYAPLVKINCSPYLQTFLCTLYTPICTILIEPIMPCRSICEAARDGCEDLLVRFGHSWPHEFRCERFPVSSNHSICIDTIVTITAPPTSPTTALTTSTAEQTTLNSTPGK